MKLGGYLFFSHVQIISCTYDITLTQAAMKKVGSFRFMRYKKLHASIHFMDP